MARSEHDEQGEKPKKGGLFDDLSLPQVAAGALAAVTSMLLASQIGIYGSVIGVGVGSVVSAVASQLYKKFLQRSAEKLRELKPGETGFGLGVEAGSEAQDEVAEREVVEGETAEGEAAAVRRTTTPSLDDAASQGDATAQRVQAKREHKKKVERGVVIVSVVSAIVAVLVSAGVVYFATQGEGVGAKTAPIVASAPKADSQAATGEGSSTSSADGGTSSGDAADTSKDQPSTDGSKDASSADGSSSTGDQQGSGSSGPGSESGSDSDSGSGDGSDSGASDGGGSDPSSSSSDDSSSGSGDTGSDGSNSGGSSGSSSGSSTPSGSSAASVGFSRASDGLSVSR